VSSTKQSWKSGSNYVYRNVIDYVAPISEETITISGCADEAYTPQIRTITITNG
jgi:hypothetical protein